MLAEAYNALDEVPYFIELVLTLVVWLVALVFVRYNKRLFDNVANELAKADVKDRSLKALDQMVDLVTIIVAACLTLYIWGIDEMLYAALTTIGIVGIMLAFAVRDIASNFISGILLILSKDILIGDAIEVKGIEGRVERINVRTTSVRRYDGALVLVPNSDILNSPVVDYHATEKRRVEVLVVIASTYDLETVTETLEGVARDEARRLEGEPIDIIIKGFEPSIVRLELRFWVARSDFITVKSEVHTRIQAALEAKGVSLDVPMAVQLSGGPEQPAG